MTIDFSDFMDALDDDLFDEEPVDVKTFVTNPQFLGLPPLSEYQYTLVECMSQIYRKEDLIKMMGFEEGTEKYKKYTKTEIIQQLGKGSGKDHTATVGVAYVVYKLLSLKDPAMYYGKPPDDSIDLINIAINAEQAKNVFFDNFVKLQTLPGLQENLIQKLVQLSLINLSLFTQDIQNGSLTKV